MILISVIWFNAQNFQRVEIQLQSLMVTYANAEKVLLRLLLVACRNAYIPSHIAKEGIVPLITEGNRFVDAMEQDRNKNRE